MDEVAFILAAAACVLSAVGWIKLSLHLDDCDQPVGRPACPRHPRHGLEVHTREGARMPCTCPHPFDPDTDPRHTRGSR